MEDEDSFSDEQPVSNKHKSLEELKQQGRLLRSAQKEQTNSLFGGVLDDSPLYGIQSQPDQVGLLYDERMLGPHCEWDPKNPECPQRLKAIWERCQYYGLIDKCRRIPVREATEKELALVHDQEYLSLLKNTAGKDLDERKTLSTKSDSVYFHQSTYEAVKLSAGSALELVDQILALKIKSGFSIARPPGHHAMYKDACGFCFVNNVAVAAKHAIKKYGLNRVLIVDLDVHHGQGTQYAFYDDPSVLYFSIHRYEHGNHWPNLRESDYDFIGEGRGRGFNINVPFNQVGLKDGDYISIFQQILLPIAYQFNPNLVLVSCGFDPCFGDPLGECELTPCGYAHLIHMLKPLAAGKLALILEGGYCLRSLAEAAALSLRELLDEPPTMLASVAPPMKSTRESILQVLRVLRPYWPCLAYQSDAYSEYELPPYFCDIEIPKQGVEFITPENRPAVYDLFDHGPTQSKEVKQLLNAALERMISLTKILSPVHRTCMVYEERMRLHKCTSSSSHPERPDRITRIYDRHKESGLAQRCHRIKSRIATEEELGLAHQPMYIKEVREFQYKNIEELHSMEKDFHSVYLSQEVYECSVLAAGCTLNVVDSVLTGESGNGVAIVRPPGHHAESAFCMGFCIFNNVAIAARYAQQKYGLKRVLILDWDVHHGNGTQNIFYEDPSVLYISLHRYDNGSFFPVGGGGDHENVGQGKGKGFNVNIPWNGWCIGDADYIAAFQQLVMPIAYQFSPELVLVSAGFDAARGDPLGGCKVSPEGFAHMTQMLSGLAMGRVILALEGGYNLNSISESMCMCTSVLLGDLCPMLPTTQPPCGRAVQAICDVQDVHSKYWSSLCFRVKMPSREETKAWLGDTSNSQTQSTAEQMEQTTKDESDSSTEVPVGQGDSLSRLTSDLQQIKVEDPHFSPNEKGDCHKLPTFQETHKTELDCGSVKQEANHCSQEQATQQDNMADKNDESSKDKPSGSCQEGATGGAEGGAVGGSEGIINLGGETEKDVMEFLGAAVEGQDPSSVQMFAVVPKSWCEHLSSIQPVPERSLHVKDPCLECGHIGENWVCLVCYEVHCSRYVNEHMLMHGIDKQHLMVLSYADLTVWCYGCDSYIHHKTIDEAKQAAHRSKFNENMTTR